jgi:hypothetical protein
VKKLICGGWAVILAVMLLGSAPAFSAVIFQDNFDNDGASTVAWPDASADFDPNTPAPVGTWGVVEPGSDADVQVSSFAGANANVAGGVQPAAHSGTKYLIGGYHYENYHNWNHPGLPCANMTAEVAKATVDCWIWGAAPAVAGDTAVQITGYAGANAAGNGAFLVRFNANGVVLWHNGSSFVTATATWTAGAWNHVVLDVDLSTDSGSLSVNGSTPQSFSGTYQTDTTMGCVRFYGDETCYFDDILITMPAARLTMQATPGVVNTVVPTVGAHDVSQGQTVNLSASRFVSCPSVYVFDHWVGNVADTHAADTTIVMNGDQTVQAVFVDGRVCGDECHPYPVGDFSHDCHVNLVDFGMLAAQWLYCTQPVCD